VVVLPFFSTNAQRAFLWRFAYAARGPTAVRKEFFSLVTQPNGFACARLGLG
jgi:hypothetical protein